MGLFRVSIGQLIIIAAVLAVDCAVIRSLLRVTPGSNQIAYFVMVDPTHSITVLRLALGVLPMGTLLVPASVAELLAIRRGNAATSPPSGLVACGWLVVAVLRHLAALSPPAVGRYIGAVGQFLGPHSNSASERPIRSEPGPVGSMAGRWDHPHRGVKSQITRRSLNSSSPN